jgi:hypothetical protein
VVGFPFARWEILERLDIGKYDLEQIEERIAKGLSEIGKESFLRDVEDLLSELKRVRGLSTPKVEKIVVYERWLKELQTKLGNL